MTITPKDTGETAEVEFEFTLSKVNEKQTIKAPAGAEPIEKLFGKLGINPLELLGAMEGGSGGLGSLLEGIGGESSGSSSGSGSSAEELELPSVDDSKEFTECLGNAESAADVQKCATLME
jgi:hypothetical protein